MINEKLLSDFFITRVGECFDRASKASATIATTTLTIYVLKDKNPLGGSIYLPEAIPGSVFFKSKNNSKWTSSTLVVCIQEEPNPIAISALYGIESLQASISYIQWIESNGLAVPRKAQSGVTKALVRGYIDSTLTKTKMALSLFSNGQIPAPFFFRNSSTNTILDPSSLESWWSFLLEGYSDSILHSWKPSKIFAADAQCTLPFYHENEKSDARKVIPLFPDDPISRHLETFSKEPIQLNAFMKSLPFRPEYVNGHGAHFWLCPRSYVFSGPDSDDNLDIDKSSQPPMKPTDFDRVNKNNSLLSSWIDSIFYKMDFSTLNSSIESTDFLLKKIASLSEIEVIKIPISDINLNSRCETSLYRPKPIEKPEQSTIINNVQNLIRKRPCP